MRAFLAIELDDKTRQLLRDIQEKLKEAGVRGNYSLPDNLHLTVKFLSEINEAQVKKVSAMMKNIASRHQLFVLGLEPLGKFKKGNKMVLWAGIRNSPPLMDLYNDVHSNLSPILPGLEDKNYSPYITLVREAVYPALFTELNQSIIHLNHTFHAEGLSLMESTRKEGRLAYQRCVFEPFISE